MSEGYDARARRDTALAVELKRRIRQCGPIPVADYMRACLQDEAHGYYRVRTAIGRGGDFITAPEISQIFGELIGLWTAVVWQQMGSPARLDLVEIGPGRGTLMADALRASRGVPGLHGALRVHLVEPSPVLRKAQAERLRDAVVPVEWYGSIAALEPGGILSEGARIILANELLDAFPVEQQVFRAGRWLRRGVGLDADGALALIEMDEASGGLPVPDRLPAPAEGDIAERIAGLDMLARQLAGAQSPAPLAMLLVDYGHAQPGYGDTLQAVRNHAFEHALTSPGESDLSAQVDFAAVTVAFQASGLTVDGPVTQSEFLGVLGIMLRASRLMSANPEKANAIEAGVARLMSPTGMGARFKAIGVRSAGLPPLPGLGGTLPAEGRRPRK